MTAPIRQIPSYNSAKIKRPQILLNLVVFLYSASLLNGLFKASSAAICASIRDTVNIFACHYYSFGSMLRYVRHTCTGRDNLTDDNISFNPSNGSFFTADRSIRQDTSGSWNDAADKKLFVSKMFGDTKQDWTRCRRCATQKIKYVVLVLKSAISAKYLARYLCRLGPYADFTQQFRTIPYLNMFIADFTPCIRGKHVRYFT